MTSNRAVAVLDVGKTLAKLSLWSPRGEPLARRTRANARIAAAPYTALDTTGIEDWLAEVLGEFAELANIGAIIPVGHGAAAAIVRDGQLACAPLDYEFPIPAELQRDYQGLRDPFAVTGSPALPNGLNLGTQLFYLENLYPDLLAGDALILPWAQYWAWLLSGAAASEVTSLGSHSDLWQPNTGTPSALANKRGWSAHLAPLRPAGAPLGALTSAWVARTGLPADVQIHCGLHDSNAALLAARGFPEIAGQEATVLSTGTWFVAMRSPAAGTRIDLDTLPEARDCLVNVDAYGQPVPSARFMGGREIETLLGPDSHRIDIEADQRALWDAVPELLATGTMVLPTFAPGFGPFAQASGRWLKKPDHPTAQRAAVALYAAMVANCSLDLIGAQERLVIEGRFAESEVFVCALATLRPDIAVYVGPAHNDVACGALRLLGIQSTPATILRRVAPLTESLCDALRYYHALWRQQVK